MVSKTACQVSCTLPQGTVTKARYSRAGAPPQCWPCMPSSGCSFAPPLSRFSSIDTDRTGTITAAELQRAMGLGGLQFSLMACAQVCPPPGLGLPCPAHLCSPVGNPCLAAGRFPAPDGQAARPRWEWQHQLPGYACMLLCGMQQRGRLLTRLRPTYAACRCPCRVLQPAHAADGDQDGLLRRGARRRQHQRRAGGTAGGAARCALLAHPGAAARLMLKPAPLLPLRSVFPTTPSSPMHPADADWLWSWLSPAAGYRIEPPALQALSK